MRLFGVVIITGTGYVSEKVRTCPQDKCNKVQKCALSRLSQERREEKANFYHLNWDRPWLVGAHYAIAALLVGRKSCSLFCGGVDVDV